VGRYRDEEGEQKKRENTKHSSLRTSTGAEGRTRVCLGSRSHGKVISGGEWNWDEGLVVY
jgi:hypothetical protein